jgi:hypothetical protein
MKKEIEIKPEKRIKKKKYRLKHVWIDDQGEKVLVVKKEKVDKV